MKTLFTFFCFAVICIFTSSPVVAQKATTTASSITPPVSIFHFDNGVEKINISIEVEGIYEINTKLGTERVKAVMDAFNAEADVKIQFTPHPPKNVRMGLLKFSIPKGKTMKTADVIMVLSNYRPADACEAMSLDQVDPSILALKLPVCIFGMVAPLSDIKGESRSMMFQAVYTSTEQSSGKEGGASLVPYIKTGKLWTGEMLIPVIL